MNVNLKTQGIISFELMPNEKVFAENGSMSFCEGGINMKPFDTSILTSIKRKLAGESFFPIIEFNNHTSSVLNLKLRYDTQNVGWFAQNSTETDILIVDLRKITGNSLVIKSGAFFASAAQVKMDVFLDSNWRRSLLGLGAILKQKLSGTGTVFIQKNRYLVVELLELTSDKSITIDPREVYAYSQNALVDSKGFSFSNLLIGEGFASYEFKGPCQIFVIKYSPLSYSQNFDISLIVARLYILLILYILVTMFLSMVGC